MIVRYPLKCDGCGTVTVLRISVGHREREPFRFECEECHQVVSGVFITARAVDRWPVAVSHLSGLVASGRARPNSRAATCSRAASRCIARAARSTLSRARSARRRSRSAHTQTEDTYFEARTAPVVFLSSFFSETNARACHPDRSARNERVAKDLLLLSESNSSVAMSLP